MEHIVQIVSGAQMFSLLDGFSGYNQDLVAEPNRIKTTFHTNWGMFKYRRMPFGLVNAAATFQCAMDIAFRGLTRQSIVVYLDMWLCNNVKFKMGTDTITHFVEVAKNSTDFEKW